MWGASSAARSQHDRGVARPLLVVSTMAAAVTLHVEEEDDQAEAPQWFEREKGMLTPIPPPLSRELLPDGTFGDRAWRARGWSTED